MQLEQLQKDMIAAMKAKDKPRKDAISSLVSAVKKVGIDEGCRDNIPEDMVNRVILKEMKTVKEQIDSCPESRTDLLEEYKARYAIFAEYAPSMMSEEEVEKILTEKFADPHSLVETVQYAKKKYKFTEAAPTDREYLEQRDVS